MNFTYLLVVLSACTVFADETSGLREALNLYNECSKSEGLSQCFKKKAIGFLDRLGRMQRFSLGDGVILNRNEISTAPILTEEQLDATLPRSLDAKDKALTNIAMDRFSNLFGESTIEISMARFLKDDDDVEVEEGRKKKGGGGGGKKGGMMGNMMMLLGAKMAALLPMKIALTFIIAKKALIIGKIALILSLIMIIKKMMKGGGGGHGSSGGHSGGGWQSSGGGSSGGHGGGWDKRSVDAQNIAYNAYAPQ